MAGNECEQLILLKAYRANEVYRIAVSSVLTKLENKVSLPCFHKPIPRLLFSKLVLAINLVSQFLQPVAQIEIHDVYCGQLASKTIQKLLGLRVICLAFPREELLD